MIRIEAYCLIGCPHSNETKRTLEEIGGELSLTRERIRQIERKALNRLRIDKSVGELRELLI